MFVDIVVSGLFCLSDYCLSVVIWDEVYKKAKKSQIQFQKRDEA